MIALQANNLSNHIQCVKYKWGKSKKKPVCTTSGKKIVGKFISSVKCEMRGLQLHRTNAILNFQWVERQYFSK